jgi:glutamate racemase
VLADKRRIGLFDSGLGGLSVLKTLWLETMGSHYIYYADLDNGPYGRLSKEQVLEISKSAFDFLSNKNVDAVLFACNTATAAAANFLRQTHKIPIFGMEPAVKPATLENPGKPVAIFATELTLREEKFKNLIDQLDSHNAYLPVPCEGLARMIDDGDLQGAWDFLHKRIQSVCEQTNVFVLGCTHYVFLKERILNTFPNVKVYDGNLGTANHMKKNLNLNGTCENSLDIILNSCDSKYISIAEDIVSKFSNSFTISLNHQIGNKTHV